jgi:hypothetical protein
MSSKRAIRRKACKGKVRHESIKEGTKAIIALRRDKGHSGMMNCYKCKFCGGYHIGHAGGGR